MEISSQSRRLRWLVLDRILQ